MYKKFIPIILSILCIVNSQAQTFQATIKAGSQANSVKLSIRPSATVTNSKLSTLYFSVAVPATASPKPTVSILNNYNTAMSYTLETSSTPELVGASLYHIYNFLGDGSQATGVERTYTSGVDNDMIEVAFGGGPATPNYSVRLVSLPNGGLTSNSYFNIFNLGTDVTNVVGMFYGASPVNDILGYLGLSYTEVPNITLPTKFLSFYATKSSNDTKLTWTVDNEENNSYFDVEASIDGRTFKSFQRVNALKNGRSSNTYGTNDINISRYNVKTIYYRIKQVEADGNVIYSEVRQVNLTDKNFSASLYPNPVKTITKLVVDAPEAMKATVLVRDANGKTVQQQNIQLAKGINQQQIDATLFPAGDYNVTIVSDKLNQTIKLTKAN